MTCRKECCAAAFIGRLFVVFVIAMCVACDVLQTDDHSSAPEYAEVIGREFLVREDLWATGITTDRNYKKRLDYVVLVPGVGFIGPEVVSRERFEKGSIIRVVGVRKTGAYFFAEIAYVVQELGRDRFKDTVMTVTVSKRTDDRNFGLDEAIYEQMQ